MLKKTITGLFIIVIIFFVGITVNTRFVMADRNPQTSPGGSIQNQINALEAAIPQITDPQLQKNMQQKLASRQAALEIQTEARKNAPAKPEDLCSAQPQADLFSDIEIPTGILSPSQTPIKMPDFSMENQWQDQINGYWFHIYAGASVTNPENGLLFLWIEETDIHKIILEPNATGALTITQMHEGPRLELTTENGNIIFFDVLAQKFITDLNETTIALDLPEKTPIFDPCAQFDTP